MWKDIPGWNARIYSGGWRRVLLDGIPHWWALIWLFAGLIQVGGMGYLFGFRAMLVTAGIVFLEKRGLQWLTRHEPNWDDVMWNSLAAILTRRNRRYFAAG